MVMESPAPEICYSGIFRYERRPSTVVQQARARVRKLRQPSTCMNQLTLCGNVKNLEIKSHHRSEFSQPRPTSKGQSNQRLRLKDLSARNGFQAAKVEYKLNRHLEMPPWVEEKRNLCLVRRVRSQCQDYIYGFPSGFLQVLKSEVPGMVPVYNDSAQVSASARSRPEG